MALNIMDLVKEQLTPNLISSVANKLGESENGVTKAISGFAPVILGSLIDKKNEASSIFESVKSFASSGIISNLTSLIGGESNVGSNVIQSLLSKLFGNKMSSIISAISSFAGIKNSSANALMNLTSGATLGSLGKIVSEKGLDASGLMNLLDSQKSGLAKFIPSGLNLGSLGLGSGLMSLLGGAANAVSGAANNVGKAAGRTVNTAKNNGGGWLKWLIGLLLLALILFFLLRRCTGKDNVITNAVDNTVETVGNAASDAASTVADVASATIDKVRETVSFDGFDFQAYKGGIEDQVITFLKSDEYKNATAEQLKTKWFNFDNINFVFGKTDQLEEGSMGQLENLAKILKANPSVKIKLGGYTDKKGDDATNLSVSQARADYLKQVLTNLGVGTQVTEAKGYGEEFATVPENASDEERAADRKMALSFVK